MNLALYPFLAATLALKDQKQQLKGKDKKKRTPNKTSVKIKTPLGAKFGFWEMH